MVGLLSVAALLRRQPAARHSEGRNSRLLMKVVLLLSQQCLVSSLAWTTTTTTTRRRVGRLVASRIPTIRTAAIRPLAHHLAPLHHSSFSTTTKTAESFDPEHPPRSKNPSGFVDFPFSYRQELVMEIETLTNRGWGLGRVFVMHDNDDDDNNNNIDDNDETSKKWVVMVPNVIPGETVRVRIFRNYANYSEAEVVEILQPSPDRIDNPVCQLSNECGGCQFQHWRMEAQRAWKTASVQESLAQYEICDTTVRPTLGTEHITGYRAKLTPHFNAPAKRRRGGPTVEDTNNMDESGRNSESSRMIDVIGFQRQTSRQIVDVPSCPIATDQVNQVYQQVRAELLAEPWRRKTGATLLFRQDNLGWDSTVTTYHQDYLTTTVRGLDFTYRAGNFFQNNYHVLPIMVDHVVQNATGAIIDNNNNNNNNNKNEVMTHVVDCYCGSGLFALSTAAHVETVVGIEIDEKAVEDATENALNNNIVNCQFRAAQAEAIFADIQHFPRDTTAVILDPPRKGCSPEFLQQLIDFRPRRIVYMSCDPTTQARDAADLVRDQLYRIQSVQPFDLFPQTRHIECLMVLERVQ